MDESQVIGYLLATYYENELSCVVKLFLQRGESITCSYCINELFSRLSCNITKQAHLTNTRSNNYLVIRTCDKHLISAWLRPRVISLSTLVLNSKDR